MKLFFHFLLLMMTSSAFAQYLHEDVLKGMEGDSLALQLQVDYRPVHVQDYSTAREFMFTEVYNINDTIETIYSGLRRYLDPQAQEPIQYLLTGADAFQVDTEHSYPRSKGATRNTDAGSDLHHLFPCRRRTNSARGNLPFGEVNDAGTITWYLAAGESASIPIQDIDAYSELGGIAFEPRENQKGNIARAIFYFYAMYREMADQEDPDFFSIQKDDLCDWHFSDPVDSLEWHRSLAIGAFQGHRANPFVLDCSLASRLYCDQIDEACSLLTPVKEAIPASWFSFPNPFHDVIRIANPARENLDFLIYDAMGRVIQRGSSNRVEVSIDVEANVPGIYFLYVSNQIASTTVKLIKTD